MFETFRNRLEITGTLTTVTALRISAGRSTDPLSVDLPVIKDVLSRPLIPRGQLQRSIAITAGKSGQGRSSRPS